MPILYGAIQQIATDPSFVALPDLEKIQYLQEEVLPKADPSFGQLKPVEQQDYIRQEVLPQIQMQPGNSIERLQKPLNPPAVSGPSPLAPVAQLGKDLAAATMLTSTGALKGATLGYLDLTPQARLSSEIIGANPQYSNPDTLAGQVATGGGELAGMLWPVGKIGSGINAGLQRLGRSLLPRTTPLAMAAGQGAPWMRQALQGVSYLQSPALPAQMLKAGAELGLYEAAKSQPGKQLDLGQRALHGLSGAALGGLFPPVLAGAGTMLRGGVQATRNLFNPEAAALGLQQLYKAQVQAAQKATYGVLETLAETFGKLQRGEIDPALVDADDYAALVTQMDTLSQALLNGRAVPQVRDALRIARRIEGKAKIRAGKASRPVESEQYVQEAQTKQQERATQPQNEAPLQPEATPQPTGAPEQGQGGEITPPITLSGSVQEMAAQVEQAHGFPANAGSLTAGQLEKQLGIKLTPEQKDAHTALRAIARADVLDPARGIHKQLPLDARALKFDAVEGDISPAFLKDAKTIDSAMGQGKAIRVEYVAEEAGRSNEVAKITKTGAIKVETTTFTPLYWGKTKDGKVLLHGYNQRGHFATYHLEPSPNGSQILKAKATDKPGFVGEYANVYLGERPFMAKDVLSRGLRSEAGVMKTSEAMELFSAASNNLETIFAQADNAALSDSLRQAISQLRDKPQWGNKELIQFKRLLLKKEFRAIVCSILGLKP